MTGKEDYAIILDYLPYGYPASGKMMPIAQAIGANHLALLELIPRRGVTLAQQEKVYIGPDKRDKIYYISGRLPGDKLSETAKIQLQEFISKVVAEQEKKYVDFFNTAQAINTRLHQIELLPGFGKKHTSEIIEGREQKPFESFEEIKNRVKNLPDPRKAVEKRIIEELSGRQRFNLFINR
jgi:putative nucleotide binding protein